MKLKLIAAAAALAAAGTASAAIAPYTSGNGELYLAVQDPVTQVSFVLDLGINVDSFVANGEVLGASFSWSVAGNANWAAFLDLTTAANRNWSVLGGDSTGNTSPGSQRLYTTITNTGTRAAQETLIETTTNGNFSNGLGSTQAGNFFSAINATGTHVPASDFSVNGSSVNAIADSGASYFGEPGGTGPTLNGGARWNSGNAIGASSNFFYVTRSGSATGGFVFGDPFAVGDIYGEWAFNGETLTYTLVPEPSTYATMALGLLAVGLFAYRRRVG